MNLLSIGDIENIAINNRQFVLSDHHRSTVQKSFDFLQGFAKNKIIYGINTGFGPMAQFKIEKSDLNQLQYNLIRSHSSGMGSTLEEMYARAVILARINSFLQGKSGISLEAVEKLADFLNNFINPEIFEHGGVGASGDLVQLAHIALNLIGEGHVYLEGRRVSANEGLKLKGITPLKLQLRDGLGLLNGTACMTGIGAINIIYAYRLINWSLICSSMINEIVESFDDSFSKELNQTKLHSGQATISQGMRAFLKDSKLITNREDYYNVNGTDNILKFKKKVQEYYSIRCVPQVLGPILDTLDYSKKIIEDEFNSTNDNPIVDVEKGKVYHGGNFHGDYISLEMDKIKTVITKLSMLSERQLNYLLNPSLNEKFPALLNKAKLGLNFGLQGLQFTATSTVAESQTLSFPNYVHSIPNNNDNQDIVSMGANSALLTKKVIENGFQVMSVLIIAICQAIDILKKKDKSKLSSKGMGVYNEIRNIVDVIDHDDEPQSENIQKVMGFLKNQKSELCVVH